MKIKKNVAGLAVAAAVLTVTTGCGAEGSEYSREVVTVSGDKFDCYFIHRGSSFGNMTCADLKVKALPGEKDTENFSRETVTIDGTQLDCIFSNKGASYSLMSCTHPTAPAA